MPAVVKGNLKSTIKGPSKSFSTRRSNGRGTDPAKRGQKAPRFRDQKVPNSLSIYFAVPSSGSVLGTGANSAAIGFAFIEGMKTIFQDNSSFKISPVFKPTSRRIPSPISFFSEILPQKRFLLVFLKLLVKIGEDAAKARQKRHEEEVEKDHQRREDDLYYDLRKRSAESQDQTSQRKRNRIRSETNPQTSRLFRPQPNFTLN